jgi:transcriptional regulator with XRE-family HTH domain
VAEPPVRFADVLRRLRAGAGLTQEEPAEAAGLSPRAVSDLERGVVSTPHKDTVRLLAEALHLDGPVRAEFEAAARGRAGPGRSGTSGVAAATRTLPRDVASFTGRRQELAELADAAAGTGAVVSIHAIGGMAGIGKTAFAVHAAHRLAARFPGGQIFVPLHGHTPGRQPVSPGDALASLLLTIGVPAGQVPADLEARAALWRDRVAGRQLLLILDDAAGSEQVRPLLPGAGGSLVLVTSRRRLTALEDARTISLDTLPPEEAAGLLVRLAVRPGLSSADSGVREITRLCGYLPLAIGMLARQLHHHPAWTVAGRAADLTAAVDRLELLATENLSVAAAFDLSYADLTADQRRLFRRVGLHPGAEADAYTAAALDGTELAVARRGLEALYDQYLLTEPAPGRYRMHDLVREHARALAGRLDPGDDRDRTTARLLENGQYYQSLQPVPSDSRAPYDPNIDIVAAAIYGAVPVTDTKLLATAALLRSQWADPNSPNYYPINGADQQLASGPVGPLLGRYPGDTYDGDTADQPTRDHPWAVSTAIFAELYYQLAQQVSSSGTVPLDSLSATFFSQIGVTASTASTDAVASLQTHGDQMLQALVYHSDHLELSEQFDAWTGYEKSVSDLSWSYASFLSAVRAKNHRNRNLSS